MKLLNNDTTDSAGIQVFCGIKYNKNSDDKRINDVREDIKKIITDYNLIDPEIPDIIKKNIYEYILKFKGLPLNSISFKGQYKDNYSDPLNKEFIIKKINNFPLTQFIVPDFNRYVHFFYKLEENLYSRYFFGWLKNYNKNLKLNAKFSDNFHNYNKTSYENSDSLITTINYFTIKSDQRFLPVYFYNSIVDFTLPADVSTIPEKINENVTIRTIDRINLAFTESSITHNDYRYYLDLQNSEIKKLENVKVTSRIFSNAPQQSFLRRYGFTRFTKSNLKVILASTFNSNMIISEGYHIKGPDDTDRKNKLDILRCLGKFSFSKGDNVEYFKSSNLSIALLNSKFLDFHISNIQKECLIYFSNFYNSNNSIVRGNSVSIAPSEFCFLIISCVNFLIQKNNDEDELKRSLSSESIKKYAKSILQLKETAPIPLGQVSPTNYKIKNEKTLAYKAYQFDDANYDKLSLNLILISQNADDVIYFVKKIYNALFFSLDLSDNFDYVELGGIVSTTGELGTEERNKNNLKVKLRDVLFDKMNGNFVKNIIE